MNKDEALKILRKFHGEALFSVRTALETLIPELESEDERIVKLLLDNFKLISEQWFQNIFIGRLSKEQFLAWLEKQKEPKPKNILTDDDSLQTAYLKGQTDVLEDPEAYGLQKNQNPAEWGEEDEEMLDIVLDMVDCSTVVPHSGGQLRPSDNYKKDISNWLKSLRPQSHWKPSDEQMYWLESAVKLSIDKPYIHGIIISLYEQLKRL